MRARNARNIAINSSKAIQIAAFFLDKTQNKRMPYLKLMKLMYLAERESLLRWGFPLTGDKLVSMKHGPVLSTVLDYINGNKTEKNWNRIIKTDKDAYDVLLTKEISYDELSKAEKELLEEIWAKFGQMTQWELRDWTHSNCKEWKDPAGSSTPIEYEDILKTGGYTKSEAKEIINDIKSFKRIDEIFASL